MEGAGDASCEYSCSLCMFSSSNDHNFIRHMVRSHQNDPKFIVYCSLCSASFVKWPSFKKHLQRKHKGSNLMNIFDDMNNAWATQEVEQADNMEDGGLTHTRNNVASFILDMRETHRLSQTAVNHIVSSTKELWNQQLSIGVSTLVEKLQAQFPEVADRLIQDRAIQSAFDFSQAFEDLETEYKQHDFFVRNFGMVDPEEVNMGTKLVWKNVGSVRKVVEEKHLGYIVPFQKCLERLLSLPEVNRQLDRSHRIIDGNMNDFHDGSYAQEHPALQSPSSLGIVAYYDDIEVVNPIGAHVKKHKISMFYWMLTNIKPFARSKLSALQLIAVAKTKHVRQHGLDRLLSNFLTSVRELSSENGLELTVNGIKSVYRGDLIAFLGDTPASNFVAGFKEGVGFASRKCRNCDVTDTDLNAKFYSENVHLRNCREHNRRCVELFDSGLSKEARTFWSREYGINSRSVFMSLPNFDVTKCFLQDPMHVLLEGVVQAEVKLLLKHLILDKQLLTVAKLNKRMSTHQYGEGANSNRPSQIDKSQLTNDGQKLKMTASEMHVFAVNLPFIIGDCVPKEDDKWVNFVRLLQILQLTQAPATSIATAETLKHLIACHNMAMSQLYDNVLTPKFHFLIHLPEQILNFGPLRHHSCMRFEGKNGYFKTLKWKCYKNLPKSLAFRHQSWMCRQQITSLGGKSHSYLYIGDLVKEGETIDISKHRLFRDVCAALHFPESHLSRTILSPEVSVHGTVFKKGSVVMVNKQLIEPVKFAKIVEIVVVNDEKLFVLKDLVTLDFDYHRNSYIVEETGNEHVLNILGLPYPWVCSQYVCLGEHHIMLKAYGDIEYPL